MSKQGSRRTALKSALTAFGALASLSLGVVTAKELVTAGLRARLYVPGYRSLEATQGQSRLIDLPGVSRVPKGWQGNRTLLTMFDLQAEEAIPVRAAYPVAGHGVSLLPQLGLGVFAGMESDSLVGFELSSMDLSAFARPTQPGWLFGGHPVNMPDGRHVAVAERHPALPRSGDSASDRQRLCGRIVIRDARTLAPVGEFSCHGIRPHEIQITADGRHMVVACYGSTVHDTSDDTSLLPDVIAPGIAVVEISSGRLLTWIDGADPAAELRHLVAPRLDRIFGITARLALSRSPQAAGLPSDPVALDGISFLPSAPVQVKDQGAVKLMNGHTALARQGLSIAYDPDHDEVLATFPSSHTLVFFDGTSGDVTKVMDTAALGLHWPCGIARSPDDALWHVTGYWNGLLTLRAGDHSVQSITDHPVWWGHSHTAIG
jgi:hypothetical protein